MRTAWEFSPEVLEKAARYVADGKVRKDEGDTEHVWRVQGSARFPYRVQTDAADGKVTWVGCSCPHGMNTGVGISRCSHAVAVLLTIRDSSPRP